MNTSATVFFSFVMSGTGASPRPYVRGRRPSVHFEGVPESTDGASISTSQGTPLDVPADANNPFASPHVPLTAPAPVALPEVRNRNRC